MAEEKVKEKNGNKPKQTKKNNPEKNERPPAVKSFGDIAMAFINQGSNLKQTLSGQQITPDIPRGKSAVVSGSDILNPQTPSLDENKKNHKDVNKYLNIISGENPNAKLDRTTVAASLLLNKEINSKTPGHKTPENKVARNYVDNQNKFNKTYADYAKNIQGDVHKKNIQTIIDQHKDLVIGGKDQNLLKNPDFNKNIKIGQEKIDAFKQKEEKSRNRKMAIGKGVQNLTNIRRMF